MRILHLLEPDPDSPANAAAALLLRFSEARGGEQRIVAPAALSGLPAGILRSLHPGTGLSGLFARYALQRSCRAFAADLVVVHGEQALPLARALRLRAPCIVLLAGPARQAKRLRRLAGVVVPSTAAAQALLAARVNPARIHVLPLPIDAGAAEATTLRRTDGRLVVGVFARNARQCGLRALFAGLATLRREGVLARAAIALATPAGLRYAQHEAARAGITEHVLLSLDARWRDLLRRCDVLIALDAAPPPLLPLIEALACARPVIASARPDVSEVVVPGRTGILIPGDDGDALLAALHQVAEVPQRARLANQARSVIRAHHALNVCAPHYEALFAAIGGAAAAARTATGISASSPS